MGLLKSGRRPATGGGMRRAISLGWPSISGRRRCCTRCASSATLTAAISSTFAVSRCWHLGPERASQTAQSQLRLAGAFDNWYDILHWTTKKPESLLGVGRRVRSEAAILQKERAMELPPSTLERMSRPGDGFRLWEYQLIRPAFEEWRRLPERQVRTFVPCWSMLGRPVRCQRLTDRRGADSLCAG